MGSGISTSAKPLTQVKRSLPGPRGPSTRKGPKVKPLPQSPPPSRYNKVPAARSNIRYKLNKQQSTPEIGRSLPGPRGPSTRKGLQSRSISTTPLSGRYRQASTSRSSSVYYEPSNQQSDDFFPWWWLWSSSQDRCDCSSDTSDSDYMQSSQEASNYNTDSHHGCSHSISHDYPSSQHYGDSSSFDSGTSSSYDSGSGSYDSGSSSYDCSSYDSSSYDSSNYDCGSSAGDCGGFD